jgi:hypothetical protein
VAAFTSNPSDILPANEVLPYGDSEGLPNHRMFFGSTSLTIQPEGEGEGTDDAASSPLTGLLVPATTAADSPSRPPAVVLMAPTPADGYLATDLLLAGEPTSSGTDALEPANDDQADYAATVDDLMAQWFDDAAP